MLYVILRMLALSGARRGSSSLLWVRWVSRRFALRAQVGPFSTLTPSAALGQRHEATRFKQIVHSLFVAGSEGQYVAVPVVQRDLVGLGFGDVAAQ